MMAEVEDKGTIEAQQEITNQVPLAMYITKGEEGWEVQSAFETKVYVYPTLAKALKVIERKMKEFYNEA